MTTPSAGVHRVSETYSSEFFKMHEPWLAEYESIANLLVSKLDFATAIDLGCGNGYIIARFAELGKEVAGVEGSTHAINFMPASVKSLVRIGDLTVPFTFGYFDLVVCLEVAEHIEPSGADTLLDNVCGHARQFVFFSAAEPGQCGYDHVNERSHEYWIDGFRKRSFRLLKEPTHEIRDALAHTLRSTWWFARNVLLLSRDQA